MKFAILVATLAPSSPLTLEPKVPYQCRMEDVAVIMDDQPPVVLDNQEIFDAVVDGCKRNFGAAACPFLIEIDSVKNHSNIRCGDRVNTAEAK